MVVENSKGECNLGQHEINFHYGEALAAADDHVIYKNGAKEIAAQEEMAITFMAKFNELEGNSCHIHCSLQDEKGEQRLRRGRAALPPLHRRTARLHARADAALRAPRQLLQAIPKGSFAPTAVAWGHDNRTCSLRVVGHGPGLRVENRLPGADVNPYLALERDDRLRASRDRERALRSRPPLEGNAYESDKPHVPTHIYEARDLFAGSEVAKEAFGQEMVDHYLNRAQVEIDANEAAVTDWEKFRGFERL